MTSIARVLFASSLVLVVAVPALADEDAPAKPKVLQVSYDSPNTRVSDPNVFSLELLGRGALYSVNYDHAFGDQMAAGFGFGSVGTELASGADANQAAYLVPVYFNFYFMKSEGSLFATGGVDMVLNNSKVKALTSTTGDVEFRSDAILPTLGLGYEYRADGGFLVRAAGYALFGDKVSPWFGASFGVTF